MIKKYSIKNNPVFYSSLFRLSIPMALTALMGSLLNIIDSFMISQLGDPEIAAVGIGLQVFFLLMVTLYGVYSGFGIFISQYWGKKDMKHLQTIYITAILSGIALSTFAAIISFVIPKQIISLFSHDPVVIALAIPYLKITAISFTISAIIFCFDMVSRSTENAMLPFLISLIGVITNSFLNYVLIFGKLGFPELGVSGAAYGTLISRSIQITIYFIYIYITKNPVLLIKIKKFVFEPQIIKRAYAKSFPVMGNEFFWALGTISIFAAYGLKGTQAQASMQLFNTIVRLLSVFTMGIANSSAIIISKKIGENEIETSKWYTKLFIYNSIRFGIITSILFIIAIPFIPILFNNQSLTVIKNIQYSLLVYAGYMPFSILAATFIVGILRSGGDTKAAFIIEAATLWGYAVPMVFILVLFTSLPIYIIYLIITFELIIKDFICYIRYKSGKYMHNLIH